VIRRGEIYWVNLDPVIGSEISKTRPGLIISNNINNEVADVVTVLPLTSNVHKIYPFEVLLTKKISGLTADSKVKANQIRSVDKKRLGKLIGFVSESTLKKIEIALKLHLGLL
jgi:mRNA interferase MazF